VLSIEDSHKIPKLSGFLEAREYFFFLELLMIVLDEALNDSGRIRDHSWRNLFCAIETPQRLLVDKQHTPQDPVFAKLRQGFLATRRKSPASPTMLLYLLLDQVADALLAHREATSDLLSGWQERLFDGDQRFQDWKALMGLRGHLRRLEVAIETQIDSVDKWREQTSLPPDTSLAVHYNDLQEHLRRVYHHAMVVQQDIDALVQIYFSANAQRTNEILQFLTVLSAVFLPLNLLASLFGMNFTHLPLLGAWYGPWVLAGIMLMVVAGLLGWFRIRRWL